MNVGKRASAKVYIDTSTPSVGDVVVSSDAALSLSPKTSTGKRVTLPQLSHDISTEQLFSDQLIDGKVADDDNDDDEDEEGDDHESARAAATVEPHRGRHRESPTSRSHSRHRKSSTSSHGHSHSHSKANKRAPLAAHTEDEETVHTMYRIESHSHLSSLEATHLESVAATSGGIPTHRAPLPPLTATTAAACTQCLHNKDMPPLHSAAYAGHEACLAALLDDPANASGETLAPVEESSLPRPYYLDKKRRTPLFYACAANRLACCALLLRERTAWRDLADKQRDTPVHVCCFFGWHACLGLLLDAGADPHGRNAKGFKPSHIAKTRQCLELLRSYGDDLQQGDKLGRTPLFVACARDRSVCVEFLCAWNHQTRSWMLEQDDHRGDRPLHAAACNGSEASLAILLKYGADPFTQNGNKMTPKDLATANYHTRCVELLANAERDLTQTSAWFAPANAAGHSEGDNNNNGVIGTGPNVSGGDTDGWIECWDSASAQPFYYNNLSGKCQWDVPDGFTPRLLELVQAKTQQNGEDENGDYVWVKKKRQTVCVATGKQSEWTPVQDPTSKAIYYKNTRTGQSQWEEPDAVQQLQTQSASQASHHATQIWDELESSRSALARALAADKHRQLLAQQSALEIYKLEIQRRRDEIRKREEQAKLQQLLPRSSFIRRKKQSMMIKIKGSSLTSDEEDKMELICQREPSLDIFLTTYLRVQGVRDLQLSIEKRFFNCLFHYYVALVDPVERTGLSKSQFRTILRDAGILPTSLGGGGNASGKLKLHVVDLIFAQASRVQALETASHPHSLVGTHASHGAPLLHSPQHRQGVAVAGSSASENQQPLGLVGFVAAMQIVRERMVTLAEEDQGENQQPVEIDDDHEWFLTTFVLPLTVRLGGKLLSQIRSCKELELEIQESAVLQQLFSQGRQGIQRLHRHYTSHEPMLSFRGLSQFVVDFGIVPQRLPMATLHQLYEAINWISGHAHTDVISFEKFQQLLTVLAIHTSAQAENTPSTGDAKLSGEREAFLVTTITAFLRQLEAAPAIHRVTAATIAGVASQDAGVGFFGFG
jgi:ankyrin repeat protein